MPDTAKKPLSLWVEELHDDVLGLRYKVKRKEALRKLDLTERDLLRGRDRRELVAAVEPVVDPGTLVAMQAAVRQIHASEALLDYVQMLLAYSRTSASSMTGLSPRAGLSLLHAAQSWALMAGRDYLVPEDVQAVLPAVVGHRLQAPGYAGPGDAPSPEELAEARDTAREALRGGRLFVALGLAVIATGLGSYARVLPGLRGD